MAKKRNNGCCSAFPLKFKNSNASENSMPADMLGSVTPWLQTLQWMLKIKSKLLNVDFMAHHIASSSHF